MIAPIFKDVDLIRADGAPLPGLVPVRPYAGERPPLPANEQAAVLDAATFNRNDFTFIDFVFFRRFSDGRSSQVAAYVVDNSDERLDTQTLAKLHFQLWLHGTAPLLYVAWPSRIDILTCARGPDFWKNNQYQFEPVESIFPASIKAAAQINVELEKEKRARFSAFRLVDGTFWEDPRNAKLANHDKAAHQLLIQAVVEADRDLEGSQSPVLRRLLLLIVLVKYLEDRRVFPSGWFGRFHKGAKSFFEVLQAAEPDQVQRLLTSLENKFNGDIFVLPTSSKDKLTRAALKRFAELVEAKTLRRQRYLWDQFSFEHLPVEVISNLYQRFVQGGHGTVYTPPFLASLLLDYAMPFEKLTGTERILDPACGSGVFLVGAFRRLVNVWRSKNNWQRPDVDRLKAILRTSIFGVEMDATAIDLTAFSLALAICDALKPDVIWGQLKFDPLRDRNLFEADFFELLLRSRKGSETIIDDKFDLITGNPPFESALTSAGKILDKKSRKENKDRGKLPDNQTAYLFLENAFSIIRPEGRVCLIQPSSFLYNSKVEPFRQHVVGNYQIDAVLDFTSIRNLYDADPKTVALCGSKSNPKEDHVIKHWTFRRTVSVQERICFELDHYDRHHVSQRHVENDPFVWRANLLGGGRLYGLSQRIRKMRTLAQFVDQPEWDYGEGFIAGRTGKREPAPFLTGKPLLPTEAFTNSGIDETQIRTVTETHFRSAYTEDRYSSPLFLVKATDSLPIAFWDKGFLAYRDKVVGIHSPSSQVEELRDLYQTFRDRHEIYRFCCALNGTQSLVGKATAILKQDIDLLPYPEDPTDLTFSFWEEALKEDVLHYMKNYVRLGQNSELLKKRAKQEDIKIFAEMFCRLLGTVYKNLQSHEPLYLNGLICQPFYFGTSPKLTWLTEHPVEELRRLVYHKENEHLLSVRVLRFYLENVILIVKPDRLRYWIRSTAVRDADETLIDLYKQGY